jgi:hypothetical protein
MSFRHKGDPRNHWKGEVKALLQRAKNPVQKRLKNVPAKQAEYLNKIDQIAAKAGIELD